jgi:two-component system CheB/CheR fusion protein
LTLVKNLVEMHGGSVQALSEGRGKGSEFIVRLPILETTPTPFSNGKDMRMEPLPSSSRRVLVVDDSLDVAESLALLLQIEGHEVRTAYDGPTALAAAEEFQPEAVFLDIGLPRMDGYEVARALRAHPEYRTIMLVAVTGYGQDEDRRRSREAGFNHHLV